MGIFNYYIIALIMDGVNDDDDNKDVDDDNNKFTLLESMDE